MDEIEIPSHFLCPISLQLMRDPVTISTGITYDRENIEKWLYSRETDNICPVTKQELTDIDLTPNHTLRRLIQAWCTLNASHGIERIPTPKLPVDKSHIVKLLNEATKCPESQFKCLQRLRSIALGSERNRKVLEFEGAVDFLASIIKSEESTVIQIDLDNNNGHEFIRASDEALNILYNLNISKINLKNLIKGGFDFVNCLVRVLKNGNYQSRAYAIVLLRSIFEVADPMQLMSTKRDFFAEVVRVLGDQISQQASKAALKLLAELCPWGRNRIKAVEGGSVHILTELLIDTQDKRTCELILIVLDQLCGCAEGRAELLKHSAGLAVVSKKILRVSHSASDRAVRILSSISRFSAAPKVLQEMLQVGVVSKLCLVLQLDAGMKTKDRAREILRLHSRVWKNNNSCIPSHLLSSFPSS